MTSSALEKIYSREARVAVVSPLSQVRLPLVKAIKGQGFTEVTTYKSLDELGTDELKKTDWIISELLTESDNNALAFLANNKQTLIDFQIRMCLVLKKEEERVVPEGSALGMLAWFSVDEALAQKDGFWQALHQFSLGLSRIVSEQMHEAQLTSNFLRPFLQKEKMWHELLIFEKSMCSRFPSSKEDALSHVEALFLAGEFQEGRVLLDEVKQMFAGQVEEDIEAIAERYPNALISRDTFADRFNIEDVIVIESDHTEMTKLEEALKKLGIAEFHGFSTYKDAWAHLNQCQKEPDLLIMDWTTKLKDLSASQFSQRIRAKGFVNLPLVILVSQLGPAETSLINDLRAMQVIKKPTREKDLLMSLAYVIQQYRSPDERKPVEYKIEQQLRSGNISYANHLRRELLRDPNVAIPRKYYIEALFHFYHGNYQKCRDLLIKGIKMTQGDKNQSSDVRQNNDKTLLLGKCLYKLGSQDLAIQMIEKVRKRSPLNMEILMELAQMNYDSGNMNAVAEHLGQAEAIDPESSDLINTKAKLALYKGDLNEATSLMQVADDVKGVISSLNNQAVKAIHNNQFDKGIKLYKGAFESLPEKEKDLLGVVSYNIALAYLRHDMAEDGIKYLTLALDYPESRVHQKVRSLFLRSEKAIKEGRATSLLFKSKSNGNSQDVQAELELIVNQMEKETAEYGVHGIYMPERHAEYAMKLLKKAGSNRSPARQAG